MFFANFMLCPTVEPLEPPARAGAVVGRIRRVVAVNLRSGSR